MRYICRIHPYVLLQMILHFCIISLDTYIMKEQPVYKMLMDEKMNRFCVRDNSQMTC